MKKQPQPITLKHFKPTEAIVGSYKPSSDWSAYTHFAVMDEKTESLIASVGYFNKIGQTEVWNFEEYKHAAVCIEQAQLYANAHHLFAMVDRLSNACKDPKLADEAKSLLYNIRDIYEPLTRLLGSSADAIVEEAYRRNPSH